MHRQGEYLLRLMSLLHCYALHEARELEKASVVQSVCGICRLQSCPTRRISRSWTLLA